LVNLWEPKRVLITVRTYPVPAHKGVEVSCTAGVTEDGSWIRLFPLPYRLLGAPQQFKKYQWITLNAKKAGDPRRESHNPDLDSIQIDSSILPSDNSWLARKNVVFPLRAHCMCCLRSDRDANKFPTLGFFKPHEVTRLRIEPTDEPDWTPQQLTRLRQLESQPSFWTKPPDTELEKVPFTFFYDFRCDHPECNGHSMSCTDWEMGDSYRSWRLKYGQGWEVEFRRTYEARMLDSDLHFYVGTIAQHQSEWLIIGLFYAPRSLGEQPSLL
jgi:hypothetical protein